MAIRQREIGWSEKSNTLWRISKQLDRLMVVWSGCCNTLTTTTTAFPCDCNTILTVGYSEVDDVFGYYNVEGDEGWGALNPNCQNILDLNWFNSNYLYLQLVSDICCESITIEIDGTEYVLLFNDSSDGTCSYTLYDISNPFPIVGETSIVRICNTICTTTTILPQ